MGRPKEFDPDVALGEALNVFWRLGFDGASLTDLTDAMGITRTSLYAAFGNKEELFRKALARYTETCLEFTERALREATARMVAERMLFGAADVQTGCGHPAGCFATNGALSCSENAEPVRRAVLAVRDTKLAALRARLARAVAEGDLPADADPDTLACFISATIHGMAVLAGTGATCKTLYAVASIALTAWPDGSVGTRAID